MVARTNGILKQEQQRRCVFIKKSKNQSITFKILDLLVSRSRDYIFLTFCSDHKSGKMYPGSFRSYDDSKILEYCSHSNSYFLYNIGKGKIESYVEEK